MPKLKAFFKRKLTIFAIVLVFLGVVALGVMNFIPKGRVYTEMNPPEIYGEEITTVYEFKKDTVIKTFVYEDGSSEVISEKPYEIKDKILYIDGDEIGEIDFFYIYVYNVIINGKKINNGYECKASTYMQKGCYAAMIVGGLLFAYSIYLASKEKKKPTEQSLSNEQNESISQ